MVMARINAVVFILCTLVWYGYEAVEVSISKSENFCENDSCLNKRPNISNTKPEKISTLSEKEVYFVATTEVPFDVSSSKKNYVEKFQETTIKEPTTSEISEKNNQSTDSGERFLNTTEATEYHTTNVTDSPNTSKTVSTSTAKINVSSTPAPFYPFLQQNSKKGKNICFCDIQTNQCDINCCCDEDCSFSHFKVFTKCNDNDYVMYDSKYCYSSNFVFGNNTPYKITKSNKGLFCIVRENLHFGLDYKTKFSIKTLEDFNKSLPSNLYGFSFKLSDKAEFANKNYLAGSFVWTVQNSELIPLRIPHSSVGLLCNSEINVKYLVDEVETCFYQLKPKVKCDDSKIHKMIHFLRETKIISNPVFLNKSNLVNSSEICNKSTCVGITSYFCDSVDNMPACIEITDNSKDVLQISCWSALSHIQYQIWHNGSEGITKVEAYLWVKKLPRLSEEYLSQITTEVGYIWAGTQQKVFRRSGNPGYLTGKPILAGKKVYNIVNGTAGKKEAIQLSVDRKNWLSVVGSKKGICSSKDRIPINFRENGQFMCSIKLEKSSFTKEKCVELQNDIFKLLIGNDIINETKDNYFNKFVATFGNSKIEETGDWVQVLIDLVPISSSPVSFKSNHHYLMCKNVITDLHIDIIYSKIGSFFAPQSKILGVSFQFGKHKDLLYYCDTSGCENTSLVQYFKLSTAIRFVDITKQAVDAFAEPLRIETKLPHDFFYPFFSKSARSQFLSKTAFNLFLIVVYFIVEHKVAYF